MYIVIDNITDLAFIFREIKQVNEFIGCSRNTITNNKGKNKYIYKDFTVYYPQNELKKSKRGGKMGNLGFKLR